jgi:prevent-host-death family protein
MKQISISDFRQRCLSLIDDLPSEGVLITRRGEPVAKIVPILKSCAELIGSAPDFLFDNQDDLFTTGIEWDAQS